MFYSGYEHFKYLGVLRGTHKYMWKIYVLLDL